MTETIKEVSLKPATKQELNFLDRVFANAIFVVKEGGYYDAYTKVSLIEFMYVAATGMPCALVRGKKNGNDDEEISSLDEFIITWPLDEKDEANES